MEKLFTEKRYEYFLNGRLNEITYIKPSSKRTGKILISSSDLFEMVTNTDFDENIIEEQEIDSFRKTVCFLKEMTFETDKRCNIGKRDKDVKALLPSPTGQDPKIDQRFKTKHIEELPSSISLEEELE